MSKEFKYKSICHTTMGVGVYSKMGLTIGDVYDIYLCDYPFSWEYEVYKGDVFYTSFHLYSGLSGESDILFLAYFYNESQMIVNIREDKLKELGI